MALTTLGSKPEGSIIKIPERGKGEVDFYVAKHNYESKLNGVGYTLVVRKDCYANKSWNSSNINAYADCNAGNIVDDDYKHLIVENIQSLINTTKFYYTPGNGNNTVTTLQRKIFLLSATELGYSYIRANVEGTALPIAGTLKIANFNGSTIGQWTRSPSLGDTRDAIVAPAHGEYCIESRCTESEGLRPAFTLPASLFISDDGSITPNTAPSVPSSITIPNSINGGTTITVSWAKSMDSEDNLEGYIVERSADGGSNWKKIYQGSGTSTTNSIPFGTASVIYRVKAYDDAGLQSGWRTSSQVNVHNNTAPTVPENINVPNSIIGGEPLTITWGNQPILTVIQSAIF